MPRNLEFKAKVAGMDSLEEAFKQNGALFTETLEQTDTYFVVSTGRLKLREAKGRESELIFYERDESSPSEMRSLYSVVPLSDSSIKGVLVKALSIKIVVVKERRLLKLKNARIHLDEVKGLGSFLEFEVVSEGDDAGDEALLEKLKGIAEPFVETVINVSYSDLMVAEAAS